MPGPIPHVPAGPAAATSGQSRAAWLQDLASEVREVQGSEVTIEGQQYVITTDRRIVEWLATYAHCPTDPGNGAAGEVCVCGWTPDSDGPDPDDELRTHVDTERADFVTRALVRKGLVPA
ncbi:hypothetical protein [Micromonospora sp. DT227]|uniref:hypothetical protein n=1 Tax=Micromonospora sp. DT227 TaxID=3393433 RepID=UPI003CF794C4